MVHMHCTGRGLRYLVPDSSVVSLNFACHGPALWPDRFPSSRSGGRGNSTSDGTHFEGLVKTWFLVAACHHCITSCACCFDGFCRSQLLYTGGSGHVPGRHGVGPPLLAGHFYREALIRCPMVSVQGPLLSPRH